MKKLDFDKPITTRTGRKVSIYTHEHTNSTYPIVGRIEEEVILRTWTIEGKHNRNPEFNRSELDLINPPTIIKGWLNVYEETFNRAGIKGFYIHSSKEDAIKRRNTSMKCLGCIYISFEEGEGL